ncbi:MAG: sigma-70 family RNA polymerase sigma factor [Pseudomonadota bacterium]
MSLPQRGECAKKALTLNSEQELELVLLWRRNGDQAARNLLIQSQLGYVLTVARRSRRPGTSINELLAEGSLGLIHAANKFDPERGYRFFTYAKHWVHVYVSKCANRQSAIMLQNTRLLGRARRERARAIGLVGEGFEARCMIAERMNLSDAEVEALLCALEQREISFEALAPEQIASDSQPRENETDPERSLLQRAEGVQRQCLVSEVLGALDARERRIAAGRLMADREAALTLGQLGKEFGVSRERVRQLEERLKQKLARQLRSLVEPDHAVREWAA